MPNQTSPKEMLWYDDDPKRSMEEKLARAVEYMRRKYGQTPELCFVHPSAITGLQGEQPAVTVDGMKIKLVPQRRVLRNHFSLVMPDTGDHSGSQSETHVLDQGESHEDHGQI
jgi:hypothetical protein